MQEEETELIIKDALADGKEISIKAFQLPIINRELLVSNLRTVMAAEGTTLLVSSLGKWKTAAQFIAITLYLTYLVFLFA